MSNPVTAKSVILDLADNYGSSSFVGLRCVEFYNDGSLITMLPSMYTCSATSELSSKFDCIQAFDTSLDKTGGATNDAFVADDTNNQRLIIVFNTPLDFDELRINNYHSNGSSTSIGVQNIVIQSSTDAITDTTYAAAVANSTQLYAGVVAEHVNSNQVDDQILFTGLPDTTVTCETSRRGAYLSLVIRTTARRGAYALPLTIRTATRRGGYAVKNARVTARRGVYTVKNARVTARRGGYALQNARVTARRGGYALQNARHTTRRGGYFILQNTHTTARRGGYAVRGIFASGRRGAYVVRGPAPVVNVLDSPTDILRHALAGSYIATMPAENTAWPVFVNHMPAAPDNVLCVYATQGRPDGRMMRTGQTIKHPGWQIRIRAEDYRTAWGILTQLQHWLDTVKNLRVEIEGRSYILLAVTQRGDFLSLGQEDNATRREQFTLNGTLTFERQTN